MTASGEPGSLSTNVSLGEAARIWAKVGLLSFGGPAGQIALMHRIVVEEKRWISESRFLHALNFCMILPGPEAQQLATYIGWLLHRVSGGLIAGTLFIVPGFVVILGLSYLYAMAGRLPLVQGLFLGLKAAVIAIVLQAVVRIGRRSLKTPGRVGLAALAFVAMFVFRVPFPYIILVAAATGFVAARFSSGRSGTNDVTPASAMLESGRHTSDEGAPQVSLRYAFKIMAAFAFLWLTPVAILITALGSGHPFSIIGTFFSKMAVVTFGGAYAVLAYVAQEAVQVQAWLTPSEMIDGLAMAETTPGPLIMVVQFVGFMAAYRNPGSMTPAAAAFLGSVLTTWVTFMPCFLWIFLGAPHIERLRQNKALTGAFSAVTAAVVGVVVNLAVWFSIHTLFANAIVTRVSGLALEVPVFSSIQTSALLITLVALLLTFRLRASVVVTLATTGALGMATFML